MSTPSSARITAIFLLLAAGPATPACFADDDSGLKWLSDFSGSASIAGFSHQSSTMQKERYRGEGLLEIEFNVVAGRSLALLYDFRLTTGTGDSVIEGLAISPMEMNYGWNLFLEYDRRDLLYRLGWHHACDHLIHKDQDPWYEEEGVAPDVFYQRFYLGAGTQTARPIEQARRAFESRPRRWLERLVWYAEAGYYVRNLGGVDTQMLYAGNDWAWRFLADLRYPLFVGQGVALFANNLAVLHLDVDDETYWRDVVRLELFFRPHKYAAALFAGWYAIDEHPRDSHDGIIELGLRLFF